MSASFLFAWCVVPNEAEQLAAKRKIDAMTLDDIWDRYLRDEFEDDADFRGFLHDKLDLVVNSDTRDVVELEFPGDIRILFTGGMSFGDSPSELFDAITDLQNNDVLPYPDEQLLVWRKDGPVPESLVKQALSELESFGG